MAEEGLFDRLAVNPLFNMGVGILGANQGNYGAFGPAFGRGAMAGMANLQNAQEAATLGEYRKAQQQMAEEKLRRTQMMQEMWGGMGGAGAGGGAPVGDAQQIRQMALQAGQLGDMNTATQLMKLSYEIDPGVQGQLAALKEGTAAAFAGPKTEAESRAKAGYQFREAGGRLVSEAELARLERGVQLAGDPTYGSMLALEAPQDWNPAGRGPVTRNGQQAIGIPQMMPDTLKDYGLTPQQFEAMSPQEQAQLGRKHYMGLREKYGDDAIAMAAYNWGPGNVDSVLKPLDPNLSPYQRAMAVYNAAPAQTKNYIENAGRYMLALNPAWGQRTDPLRVPTEAEKVEQSEMAKLGVEELKEAKTVLSQTDAKLGTLQVMDQLLDQISTGRLQPAITDIKAWADGLGVNLPGIERLAPAQAFDALAKQMVLKARNTADGGGMPGAMSDADREFLRKMVPGLEKTRGANRLLLDITRRLTLRERQIAQLRSNYANKYKTMRPTTDPQTGRKVSIDEALDEFRNRNRLFDDEYVNSILGTP